MASGRASERRLEAITANLANINTPAYKRQSSATKAFHVPGPYGGDIQISAHAVTDFTQGDLRSSASPYHLGISGSGFFAVEGPTGEMFTRNGTFHVNRDGVLLSEEGFPVVWNENAAPIDPTGEMVTVSGSGEMRQGTTRLGQLKVVEFDNPRMLGSNGGGYFEAKRGMVERASEGAVHQYRLESSNVSSVDELVGLISAQRSFESAKNVMQLIDQTYGRLTALR